MKKNIFILLFLMTFTQLTAQTKKERLKIIKEYDQVKINLFTSELTKKYNLEKKEAYNLAILYGWDTVIKTKNSFSQLIRVIDNKPIYRVLYNKDAAKSTRTNTLHNNGSLGLNLEGQNMIAGVWDGGYARTTHQEYDGLGGNNRYSRGDSGNLGLHFHAAHVTGTIMASGVEQNAKGMAPQSSVIGYDWDNDASEVSSAAANGLLLSNHSYGLQAPMIPDWLFGAYNESSQNFDQIMYNSPYYLLVCASGNDGQDASSNSNPLDGISSYDKLTSEQSTSKNSLVVANAQDANIDSNGNLISVSINSSSSQGPTDDYRIKPDITGNGTQLYSTFENADDSYASISGTSMASPNVTGSLLLLQQYYNQLNGNFMKAATLKGLVLHTADDAGNSGPDAIFGWGLLNAKKAAIVIEQNNVESRIDEITLTAGQTYSTTIQSDGISSLIASISWTDPAGNISNGTTNDHSPVLVNDLDLRISKDGVTYYPYKLSSVNTNTLGDNIVDPYERIDIDNPSGNYIISVTHKGSLNSGSQNFSLIVTGTVFVGVCNAQDPTNTNTSFIFSGNSTLSWDEVIGATYEVRYKPENTSTWINTTSSSNNIELTGLTESSYNAQVRSVCDNDGIITYSNWVDFDNAPIFVVKTTNYIFDNYIKSYSDSINLNIVATNNYTITNINIYNILGKQLLKKATNNNMVSLDKSIFGHNKLLIIKITLDNGMVGYKKIVLN